MTQRMKASAAYAQFTAKSGNQYTADGSGIISSVTDSDVNDLEASGCVVQTSGLPNEAAGALTTVGAGVITAALIDGRAITRGGAQSGTAFTDTTDTALAIIAAITNATPGQSFEITYVNNTNAAATIVGGVGVNSAGTIAVVPRNASARFLVVITSLTAVTLTALGQSRASALLPNAIVGTADDGTTQTLTAAMVTGGKLTTHVSTGGATPTLTLPLASAVIAAVPNAQPGDSYVLRVINSNSGTATVATNTNWTLSGTLTLATNTWRDFLVTVASATTLTGVSIGTGTNS